MHPYLFGVIESYAVFLILGIVAALALFEVYFRKILKEKSSDVFYLEISLIVAVAAGILGAYLWQNLYDFIQDPSHYSWNWSLTFYGGLIFGVGTFFLMYFLYARKHYPEGLEKILWIAPASITLAHGIGRIGCFMAGCCYGHETHAWYGVQFATTSTTVVPTNLFEAIFLLLLSGVLLFLAIKKHCPYSMPIYLVAYGVWRFFIEFVRGDYRGSFIPGLTPSQFWSILLVIGGIAYFLFRLLYWNKRIKDNGTPSNA